MNQSEHGFTLIELIAVIVILGILAATAAPRFVSLQDESALATTRSIAGSIESGVALNHTVDIAVEANSTSAATDPFYNISNCTHGERLLSSGALPVGYTIASMMVDDKEVAICTLIGLSGSTADFVIIGAADGIDPK